MNLFINIYKSIKVTYTNNFTLCLTSINNIILFFLTIGYFNKKINDNIAIIILFSELLRIIVYSTNILINYSYFNIIFSSLILVMICYFNIYSFTNNIIFGFYSNNIFINIMLYLLFIHYIVIFMLYLTYYLFDILVPFIKSIDDNPIEEIYDYYELVTRDFSQFVVHIFCGLIVLLPNFNIYINYITKKSSIAFYYSIMTHIFLLVGFLARKFKNNRLNKIAKILFILSLIYFGIFNLLFNFLLAKDVLQAPNNYLLDIIYGIMWLNFFINIDAIFSTKF